MFLRKNAMVKKGERAKQIALFVLVVCLGATAWFVGKKGNK